MVMCLGIKCMDRTSPAYLKNDVPESLKTAFRKSSYSFKISKGKNIILQDDVQEDVYLLDEGRAEISIWALDSSETIFREMRKGQIFGELAALDSQPRSVSVTALENCSLYRMSGGQFKEFLKSHAEFRDWFYQYLANRIRNLSEKVFELAQLNVGPRLWKEILRLAEENHTSSDTVVITNFPSKEKLAARLGAGREAINRELKFMVSQNTIEKLGRGRIKVNSLSNLNSMLDRIYDK